MRVIRVLINDRYEVESIRNSRAGRKYRNVVVVDKLKPWIRVGGVSDED